MPINPILSAAHVYVEAGKQISRISVDNHFQSSKVILEFTDRSTANLSIYVVVSAFVVL
jgi:hypothetical protein